MDVREREDLSGGGPLLFEVEPTVADWCSFFSDLPPDVVEQVVRSYDAVKLRYTVSASIHGDLMRVRHRQQPRQVSLPPESLERRSR